MITRDLFSRGLKWLKHYAAIIAIIQAIIFPITFVYYNAFTEDDIFMFGADVVAYEVLREWHTNTSIYGYRSLNECEEFPDYYLEVPCSESGLITDLQMITEAFESYDVVYDEININVVLTTLYPLVPPEDMEDILMSRIVN